MKKSLVPKWVDVVYVVIPTLLPLLHLMLVLMDRIYGFTGINWAAASSAAVDLHADLSPDVGVVFVSVAGLFWSIVGFAFQTIWGFGSIAVYELKQFLHNRKTPQ